MNDNRAQQNRCGAFNSFEEAVELLPDFMLGELPESQAVLVQEALQVSPELKRRYDELKGTGRALEAVPQFRSIAAQRHFSDSVLSAAQKESEKIIQNLPADRRMRMELQRARRQEKQASRRQTAMQTRSSGGIIALIAIVIVIVGAYFLFNRDQNSGSVKLGELRHVHGKVEQFFQQGGSAWSAVFNGQSVRSGESYAIREQSGARFEAAGGTLFLGAQSEVALKPQSLEQHVICRLASGQAILDTRNTKSGSIQLELDAITIKPGAGTVLLAIARSERRATIALWRGRLEIKQNSNGMLLQTMERSGVAQLLGDSVTLGELSSDEQRYPDWRFNLLDAQELDAVLPGAVHAGDEKQPLHVTLKASQQPRAWILGDGSAGRQAAFTVKDRKLTLPHNTQISLNGVFSAPLTLEIRIDAQTPREAALVCSLESGSSALIAEFDKEAQLQVRDAAHPGRDQIAYRNNPGVLETITLRLLHNPQLEAELATTAGKTKRMSLPSTLATPEKIWIKALDSGLQLEELSISGNLSLLWLHEQLKPAQ